MALSRLLPSQPQLRPTRREPTELCNKAHRPACVAAKMQQIQTFDLHFQPENQAFSASISGT
jgi:hypothetical protein